jgi:putative transposase
MVGIIREADRDAIADVAKRHGISEQTIYTWRKRFGELRSEDVRRLRQLEIENGRLKKLVAERDLEIEVMKGNRCERATSRQRLVMADTDAETTGRVVQWIVMGIKAAIKAGIRVSPIAGSR